MPAKLTDRRALSAFTALCCLVYFTSYLTRLSYAAALTAIIADTGFSMSAASLAVTGSFFTYGLGQLASGIAGDRVRPHRMIAVGLLLSSACNLLLPFCPSAGAMALLWCVNGFFQSMIWPPLVRIMSGMLDAQAYYRCTTAVTSIACAGTVVIYLAIPLASLAGGWRLAFYLAALCGLVVTFLWLKGAAHFNLKNLSGFSPAHYEQRPADKLTPGIVRQAGLGLISLAIILLGVLREGVTTWMPANLSDNYHLPPESSIAITAIVSIFSIGAIYLAGYLQKKFQNEMKTAFVMFAFALVSTVLLVPLMQSSVLISTVLMMACISAMHGANNMFISRIPAHFVRYGCVSSICGVLNFFIYVGAALSTYGVAVLTERFGWMVTLIVWAAVALCGTLLCLFRIGTWRRFTAAHTNSFVSIEKE